METHGQDEAGQSKVLTLSVWQLRARIYTDTIIHRHVSAAAVLLFLHKCAAELLFFSLVWVV